MKYARYVLAAILLGAVIFILSQKEESGPYLSISGFTQGTTYHMTYQSPNSDSADLQAEIDALLAIFDQSLSTYIDSSNISKINMNMTDLTDPYFDAVFNESKRVYKLSDGAFDITVGPLIDAWGFGPGEKMEMSEELIDSLLQYIGMKKVSVEDGIIIKKHPQTRLDVNAIAQGYAVDIVCEYLEKQKIVNYMVEIGGELRTKGVSEKKIAWRVGIDKPYYGNQLPGQSLQAVVSLSGKALASSGNYRKYYEVDGKKIVHTLDPRTGLTRMSELLSVTIITDKCITADAYATTCMVLGLEAGIDFIEKQENTEALFIYTDDDGLYLEWKTEGMNALLTK